MRTRRGYSRFGLILALAGLSAGMQQSIYNSSQAGSVRLRALRQHRAQLARLRQKALHGDAAAADKLGWIRQRGNIWRNHPAAALRWFRLAAREGYASSMSTLGDFYFSGQDGLPANAKLSAAWYRRAAMAARAGARRGDAAAENTLAWLYEHGRGGVRKNDRRALEWFRRSARQHFPRAMTSLGWMHQSGLGGLKPNLKAAAAWYTRAAMAGNPTAQNNLAWLYLIGQKGMKPDQAKGQYWLQQALGQGSNAAFNTWAYLYKHGAGGYAANQALAEKYFQLAARRGDDIAQNNLAWFYLTSPDRQRRNPQLAVRWGRRAVAGDPGNDQNWDTLAAAYFQAGKLRQAVAAERRAVALATPADRAGMQKTLRRYLVAAARKKK